MQSNQWPKTRARLTEEQERISDEFMQHWLEVLAVHPHYSLVEKFNHGYVVEHAPKQFVSTLEIGAGVGGHFKHEILTEEQKRNYVAIELRENIVKKFKESHPDIRIELGDCQKTLPFKDGEFDRILAIHVLEHLPNLPAALKEMHRLCNKKQGIFSVVIPCEGGMVYGVARKISAEKIFVRRYKQPYKWFIENEHINMPREIMRELSRYFKIEHKSLYPFSVPIINLNLCIGLTLRPRTDISVGS